MTPQSPVFSRDADGRVVVETGETSSVKEGTTPVLRLGDKVRVRINGFAGEATVQALDVPAEHRRMVLVRDNVGRRWLAHYREVTRA